MPDPVLSFVLAAHAAAVLLGMLAARQKGRRLSVPYACFMLALPVFGAAVCWVFALASPPRDGIRDPMMRNTQRHEAWVGIRHEADRLVPLEEAFLINEPKKRRELMMDLLRSEPRKHLDLLLLARFNEDPETAHYATATLTEVQRQMQLELQQMQTALLKNPQDAKTRLAYIELLNGYVDSGLLEGQLLERQRRMLGKALDELPEAFNILKGDMSLVGPRPERVEHVKLNCRRTGCRSPCVPSGCATILLWAGRRKRACRRLT